MTFESLTLSINRKIQFFPKHKNTFGLSYGQPVNGGTCPGATSGPGGCLEEHKTAKGTQKTCYMDKVVRIYPNAGKTLVRNTELLQGKTEDEMVVILRNTVMKWLLNGGYKSQYFRLHYSGDFFSEGYAKAWTRVIMSFPYIKFWVYTRSFEVIPVLVGCKNLSIYLSCDPVNILKALPWLRVYQHMTNVGMAWMGDEIPPGLPKLITCPEISGKVKNTAEQGACSRCRLCMTHTETIKLRNIHFPIH